MDTHDHGNPSSLQRAMQSNLQTGDDAQSIVRLTQRMRELEEENARLRSAAESVQQLEDMNAQLREANSHLVFATVNAQHLQEDAEAANRRQNEFLAMLAHELRNPLAPISMAASLLDRMTDAPPQSRRLTSLIARQVDHMARLLDDLLDAARISSGKITLSTQPLALADVLRQAIETIQPSIQQRGQILSVTLPDASVVVDGDQVRLIQVFTNLLSNASRYTQDGGTLTVSSEVQLDTIAVAVEDNGTGLAQEIIPYIFDMFTQGPRSLARSEGGLGIGLNVVRNLVHKHGGTVEVDSAGPGLGSRFTVHLPRSASSVAVSGAPNQVFASGVRRRVLVIEDNPDTNATLAACLRQAGHEVVTAFDGRAGLAAALERPFDVILCDVGLPGMDGMTLIRTVRAASNGARILAIALSGYGQAEDRERGLAAGFDDYLVKPVKLDDLLGRVAVGPAVNLPHT